MKILQLCKKFPFPLKDGEALALYYLSKSLIRAGCTMDLLAVNTPKHFFPPEDLDNVLIHYDNKWVVELDTRVTSSGLVKSLFSRKPYHISRFDQPVFHDRLQSILKENRYDYILVESLFMYPYAATIRKNTDAPIILRAHNVESEIWERVAGTTQNLLLKMYLSIQTARLKKYEAQAMRTVDALVPISGKDEENLKKMGFSRPSFVYPICMDADDYKYSEAVVVSDQVAISFIGSLDWMPNQEGLKWFLDQCWPIITDRIPAVKLHIAGRNMPEQIQSWASDNIIIHGEVEDAHEFLQKYPVSIVPLHAGSGMRVKIIEAMALGPAIVSTSIGAEGIPYTNGEHILIADQPDGFADAVVQLLEHKNLRLDISRKARALVVEEFDYRSNGDRLYAFIEKLQIR